MKKLDDGGPAFPSPESFNANGERLSYFEYGMTLRDWFAGQALVGITTDIAFRMNDLGVLSEIAKDAYSVADAMLAERAKGGGL